jgi:hypothetical protein
VVHDEERCPTCSGTGHIVRDQHHWPCPTCSPASSTAGIQYLHPEDTPESVALGHLPNTIFLVASFGCAVALALFATALWN